jgi:hypothetical protein
MLVEYGSTFGGREEVRYTQPCVALLTWSRSMDARPVSAAKTLGPAKMPFGSIVRLRPSANIRHLATLA